MTSGKRSKTSLIIISSLTAMLMLTLPTPDTQAAVTFRTVVMAGDQVPGTNPGVVYSSFDAPTLNASGQVAFQSYFSGPNVDYTNALGISSEGSGSLSLVARTGDHAPGTSPSTVYSGGFGTAGFSTPLINVAGQTAFSGILAGPDVDSTNSRGIWSQGPNTLDLVARTGNPAPGTDPGVVFSNLQSPVFNAAGQTAFLSSLTGPGVDNTNNLGAWSQGSGPLSLVTRKGDVAPDTESGVTYDQLDDLVINDLGQTALIGELVGPGVDDTNRQGIWSESNGSLGVVIRAGTLASEAEPNSAITLFTDHTFNNAGQTTFIGTISDQNADGIWSINDGSLSLVAKQYDPAPGTESHTRFSLLDSLVRTSGIPINTDGQTAFNSLLQNPGQLGLVGIWTENNNESLQLIARSRTHAPGTNENIVFSDPHPATIGFGFRSPTLNNHGQVAFAAEVTELVYSGGINHTNDLGVWATDTSGQLQLIFRKGDLFDVNDDPLIDDLRTIAHFEMITGSGGEDGRATNFNDAGQLAFHLSFTDGTSGIFVATIGLPGDLNGDGFVGIDDLAAVLNHWNQNVTPGDTLAGDATGDGYVGIDDLNTVLGNWNAGTPPSATPQNLAPNAPEPASLLILTSLLGLHIRRV